MARNPYLRYSVALATVTLAVFARLLLDPVLGVQYPFATVFLAVVVTTWYGGLRPALLAVLLGALASDFFLLPPRAGFHLAGTVAETGMVLYLITGLGISLLAGSLQRAGDRAELKAESANLFNRDLESRAVEHTAELARQSLLLDLAHDTISIRDHDDRITYWNKGAERLYGWSQQDALGQVTHSLLATRFPQPLDEIAAHVLATGSWNGELVHTRRDGSLLTVVSSWTLQRVAPHQSSVLELSYDITARKKAERELETNRARLDAIFKGSLDGIVVFESIRDETGILRDLRFTMVNPAAERLTGMNACDLIGHTLLEKFPGTGPDGMFEKFARTIAEDTTLETEYFSAAEAKPEWKRVAAVKLGDGLVVHYNVITADKLAEEKRQTLARRLGLATEVLQAGIWEWDLRTNLTQWDDKMYEIYGLAENPRMSYAAWTHLVTPADLPFAEAALRTAIASKSQGSSEFRIVRPNGTLRDLRVAFGTILDDRGQVIRVVGADIDVTERKRTEERFQLVVEAVPNAMIVVSAEGLMTLVNTQTEKLFGYERGELLGQNVEMLIPWQFRAHHRNLLSAFFAESGATAKRAGRELRGMRRDGSEVPVEIALSQVGSPEGQFVLASIVDITERKRAAEHSLLLTAVIEGAKDYAIFMLDPEGRVLTWNEGAARLKGYSEAEIVGQHFSRFYLPEAVKSGHPENELRMARAMGKCEDEGWRVRRDGSRFWATVLIAAVYDKDGKLRGFSKLTRDTTERKRTEERFQRVVEAAPSAMIMVAGDGLMTLVNNQTEKLFGYHRSELLGLNIAMLIPAPFRFHHGGQLATFFAAPVARAMGARRELFGLRKDGREVAIEISLSPIVTEHGQFVLAAVIDITERKRYEAELQSKSAEMERFTYTVSHDLKSPLITIKSYISMIDQDLEAGNTDRVRADLQRVSKAADRMKILLDEVLALSRVGRVENPLETVAFGSLVEEALEVNAGRIQQGNVRIEVAPDLPSVTVDRARIIEVLQNLIDNATKFMGNQTAPEIRIGALNEGAETRFFVKDNGVGLEARYHQRIFGLFDKLNPKSEGSGAGLAIVKRIIELQKGRIWVESAGSGGATFWFTLGKTE
jgi:PAS domain S-box-containing protein